MPRSPKGQTKPQQAVRVGHFEKAMEAFNREMSQKIVEYVSEYHIRYIGSAFFPKEIMEIVSRCRRFC